VDEERFEGELVLVNRETSWVIVLNDAGSVLWDALRWPQTIGTLLGMLIEARPGASVAELADRVSSFVHTLASGRVLRRE
jgi:hypothetical protein